MGQFFPAAGEEQRQRARWIKAGILIGEQRCQLRHAVVLERAYANGARKGALRALVAVLGLLVGAVALGRRK